MIDEIFTKYAGGGGGGGEFSTCMPKGFRCPFKVLSYANLSERGSFDEMNKESRVEPFD